MNSNEKINQEEFFGILNGRISMLINRYLYGCFKNAGLGITVEQWTILAILWQKDKVTQQTLSDMTFRDKPSITRLIDNLEKQKLVVRVPDTSDRRANLIYLTQKGIDLENKASIIINEVVDATLAKISDEEMIACRNVLKKVLDNLV